MTTPYALVYHINHDFNAVLIQDKDDERLYLEHESVVIGRYLINFGTHEGHQDLEQLLELSLQIESAMGGDSGRGYECLFSHIFETGFKAGLQYSGPPK
jgi:hypothetical protein